MSGSNLRNASTRRSRAISSSLGLGGEQQRWLLPVPGMALLLREEIDHRTVRDYGYFTMASSFSSGSLRFRFREWRYRQRRRLSLAYFPSRRLRQRIRAWRAHRPDNSPGIRPTHRDPMQ